MGAFGSIMTSKAIISDRLNQIVKKYETISLNNGQEIPCPYWMNKLRKGRVFIRGQYNGKGSWHEIQKALNEALAKENVRRVISYEKIQKLAKRHRIGIDCSGFIFRVLEHTNPSFKQLFPFGINKTNAKMLTDKHITRLILKAKDIMPGDLIRMMGGKHAAIILKNDGRIITYVHSATSTLIRGVHRARIKVAYPQKGLEFQTWEEKTNKKENFGKKYFNPQKGDSIRRLTHFS